MGGFTHDSEEYAAFVPPGFDGATEGGGEGVDCWVFELVETFCLQEPLVVQEGDIVW
jgi:hypothetical protein